VWESPRLAIINLQKKKKRHCKTFKPHLNQREGSFRGDDFYIHQSQNASIITAKDHKPLSPAASRLHWMPTLALHQNNITKLIIYLITKIKVYCFF
jgi:hypothetical protein